MSVTLALTRGLMAIVDKEDLEILASKKWFAFSKGGSWYAARTEGYGAKKRTIYMHRLLLAAKVGEEIDHANGNSLDNRKQNLRLCTHRENIRNQKLRRDNKIRLKGVHLIRKLLPRRWKAEIVLDDRKVTIGYFTTAIEAARAYDAAAIEHFGAFARTNRSLGLLEGRYP